MYKAFQPDSHDDNLDVKGGSWGGKKDNNNRWPDDESTVTQDTICHFKIQWYIWVLLRVLVMGWLEILPICFGIARRSRSFGVQEEIKKILGINFEMNPALFYFLEWV